MILRIGDSIAIGEKISQQKKRFVDGKHKEYTVETRGFINPGVFVSYNLQREEVEFKSSEFINLELKFHFSYEPLEVGPFGMESFMLPDALPYNHLGMVLDIDKSNYATHRLSNKKCRIIYDFNFFTNGQYKLEPADGGDAMYYTSKRWDRKSLIEHLDNRKGTTLVGKAKVFAIYYNDVYVPQINLKSDLSRTEQQKYDRSWVVLEFQNGTLCRFPLFLIE